MATVKKVVKKALRLLAVTESGEVPSSEEMDDAVDSLNSMLHSWQLKSIPLNHIDVGIADTLPYPEDHTDAITHNLAIYMAPEYGVSATVEVIAVAESGFDALQNFYCDPEAATTDPALDPYFNPNQGYIYGYLN